jgi:hypothetical protein
MLAGQSAALATDNELQLEGIEEDADGITTKEQKGDSTRQVHILK